MAGAYNHNVQKMTEDFMEEVPGHHKLYVLGMVGVSISAREMWIWTAVFIIPYRSDYAQSTPYHR